MEWMLLPLKRYADFSGRSRRKEYWMFALLMMIVNVVSMVVLSAAGLGADGDSGGFMALVGGSLIFLLIFAVVFLIPSIAVGVRRLHDQDKSGWFILLGFIPYVGAIILLVLFCLEGTVGDNRYGPDPKAAERM
jgi:uncharacterized membrane protein YhaH (DUF805 family)